jgi:hypothetical protein
MLRIHSMNEGSMQVELKPGIAAILKAQVAAGHFATIEDAVSAAVLGIGPDQDGAVSDLTWAKPYVDQGLASLARGEGIPHDQMWAELKVRFAVKV